MNYKKQDIVLVPFPFIDRPGFKKRPAVIISKDAHYTQYSKYVCVAITSQEKRESTERYEHKLYKAKTPTVGLLFEDQCVLPDKVFSIEDSFIIKRLGVMEHNDFTIIDSMFHAVFN
jgi:mRNA interferase MazF